MLMMLAGLGLVVVGGADHADDARSSQVRGGTCGK